MKIKPIPERADDEIMEHGPMGRQLRITRPME